MVSIPQQIPQGPYNYVRRYDIGIDGTRHSFYILASKDGFAAWMPDNEQQHVNIGYNGASGPAKLNAVTRWDVAKMLSELALIKSKKQIPLEDIIGEHDQLIKRILQDFQTYQAEMHA